MNDRHDDQLDDMLKGPAWEPPPGFARRVATIAIQSRKPTWLPRRVVRGWRNRLEGLMWPLEGPVWIVRQYWTLIVRT